MKIKRKNILLILSLILVVSCSTQKHFNLLSFFFDGVPDPNSEALTLPDELDENAPDSLLILSRAVVPEHWYHQPYQRKECPSCHDRTNLGEMNERQPELCFGCHLNYETRFTYKHGPSSGGYCTECHHPHESDMEHLLLMEGNSLCLNCHDSTWHSESIYHNLAEEHRCQACHNPHGSNNHSVLVSGSCYRCHEDLAESFAMLHGPVSSGYCSSCHGPHGSGGEYLLKKTGNELCLHCHETGRLLGGETHSDLGDMLCRDCHHPHGGSERYFFLE